MPKSVAHIEEFAQVLPHIVKVEFLTEQHTGVGSELEMVMDAKAYKLLARVMNPLICGMITKAVEGDVDAVKGYCERQPVG